MKTEALNPKERLKLEKKNYKKLVSNKTNFADSQKKVINTILSARIPRFGGLKINNVKLKT